MVSDAVLTWWYLGVLTKQRFNAVVDVYGDLDEGLGNLSPTLLSALGCRAETVEKTMVRLQEFDVQAYRKELARRGIEIVVLGDEHYPAGLSDVADPPPFLSYRGDYSIIRQPTIGCVGTRRMTAYGKRVTQFFIPPFVRNGIVTVSGLAMGIDACVAEETIVAGGRTIAVLGHGLGTIYPKSNARLAEQIVGAGGLLISEYPFDMLPDKYTFPARNRIIAGLSIVTLVLEAPEDSGAIITAELALGYGREVFAVPGQIFDSHIAGSHRLIIKNQAKLVTTPEEVLSEMEGVQRSAPLREPVRFTTPSEERIYQVLTSMPQSLDDLLEHVELDPGSINAALTMMEITGAAKNVGSGNWVRA